MAKSQSQRSRPRPVTSLYCKPSASSIHQRGLFATRKIPADTEIIQYVGEKVSKDEGDRRAVELAEEREGTEDASVYMFILDDEYDIDGNVPHNTAKLINHSCDPNCEAQILGDEIWMVALRDIEKGEELTFDYGFDLEHYEEHPCHCGSPACVGYIVAREYWPKLRKKLAAKKKQKVAAVPAKKKPASGGKKSSALAEETSPDKKKAATVEKGKASSEKRAAKKEPVKAVKRASDEKSGKKAAKVPSKKAAKVPSKKAAKVPSKKAAKVPSKKAAKVPSKKAAKKAGSLAKKKRTSRASKKRA